MFASEVRALFIPSHNFADSLGSIEANLRCRSPTPTPDMRWLFSEYICKGMYLGLLLFVALQASWHAIGIASACTVGGLVIALAIAGARKLREGYRVRGRWLAFMLFLVLENPLLIYAGVLVGLAVGAYGVAPPEQMHTLLPMTIAGGVLGGIVLWGLKHIQQRYVRLGLCLALAIAVVGGVVYWNYHHKDWPGDESVRQAFGSALLLGIPLFYLLTFGGVAEESEVEFGATVALLAIGLWMVLLDYPQYRAIALTVPILLYFFYCTRVLSGTRVLKHTIRGLGHARAGRYRPALLAFRRALQIDPKSGLARESLWGLHRDMDPVQIARDPETLALVDFDLCLERIRSLLLEAKPTPAQLAEARHLLDLIQNHRPALQPAVLYWRAVARLHARDYDQAATDLESLLDSSQFTADDPQRAAMLFPGWQLALLLHPEMNRRVGTKQLTIPGRRMQAIAAVERTLAKEPENFTAWDLKRLLYSALTEAEYDVGAGAEPAKDFDHSYVQQLGLALIHDTSRWQRGVEYLRMTARGLPGQAPTLYKQIAEAYQNARDYEMTWRSYEMAQRIGRAVGPKNLADPERTLYFAIVKMLADEARTREDLDAAIENYQLYTECERSGLETLRTLSDLYERKAMLFDAVRVVEKGLLYNRKDADLLERRDRYYYSVMPDDLRRAPEAVQKTFDAGYCVSKARTLLDHRAADLDVIDWAQHLTELASVLKPDSIATKVLRGRALRRRGEIEAAQGVLQDAYRNKPEKFASGEDEESWYVACRLLGEMYLNDLNQPEQAIACFKDYRKSSKSGADTIYKIGQAYEQLGDYARAAKHYEHVTAYSSHPLVPDAREALSRLQSQTQTEN
jgi:tetratricopeptide (TPR) repeat protein